MADPRAATIRLMADGLPATIRPMLARAGTLPVTDGTHGYEVKWDGVRAIASVRGGDLRLRARTGADVTARYPELAPVPPGARAGELVLDGEVVAFDEHGRPSFERLQSRMHLASAAAVARRLRERPVTYVVFDLLHVGGRSLLSLAYRERRALLAQLGLEGPAWRAPAHRERDGAALLAATAEQALEGVVAKRLDSPYEPGRRSGAWIKVLNHAAQDVVVGGFTRGEGGRSASLGALAVGTWETAAPQAPPRGEAPLRYAGRVGSGFTQSGLADLMALLEPLRRSDSPFSGRQPPRGTSFVEPRLVARVQFREWTVNGTLRGPVFKGLRDDVDPAAIVREG